MKMSKPEKINRDIFRWARDYTDIVRIDEETQFTGDKVYAITVEKRNNLPKRNLLVAVPHAHEPAGTVAIMEFLSELITGKDAEGNVSQLPREEILKNIRLTCIPIGNPFGRKNSPVEFWDGTRFSLEEFIYIMVGRLMGNPPPNIVNEFWHNHPVFNQEVERLEEIGIVWEKLSEKWYGEPHFYKGCTWWKLVERISDEFQYSKDDLFLELHQTEMYPDKDCMVIHPREAWIPPDAIARADEIEEKINRRWREVGGSPYQDKEYYTRLVERDKDLNNPKERRKISIDWLTMKTGTPCITIEVQMHNPNTPAQKQILLEKVAIEVCVELLLKGG
ncbi:MAG: hypothetical protein N3D17_04040 [bacterium]|nr:hypothetical protein [bacterium]